MSGAHTNDVPARPHRRGWLAAPILAAAGLSMASGFAQFTATATLGDVAGAFGHATGGGTVVEQAGLAGTTLGIGLAVVRLASLASLPLAEAADRHGRRRVLLTVASTGLALTAAAALSPSFWALVAVLALGRPLLSATNAVAGVVAAEETDSRNRARALGLITAAYGLGAGATALVRAAGGLDWRVVFALALVPLALLPLLARPLHETDRYTALRARLADRPPATGRLRLGNVPHSLRPRLALLAGLALSIAFVTGPVNSLLFLYAEAVVGLSPGVTAMAVLAAGPLGLTGLLVGRWAADHLGRRRTASWAQAVVALAGIATYQGGGAFAIGGYLATILAASAFAPASGALAAELFPTSARATAAGWMTVAGVTGAVAGLVAFGVLADVTGFAGAAWSIGLPVVLVSPLWLRLPETRGLELEQSAPEPDGS